jgi:hypothetical protein
MTFSSIDPPKRGFSGRPLIALLFAIGMGILAVYIASRWQLDGAAASIILVALVGIAGYLWYRLEKPAVRK